MLLLTNVDKILHLWLMFYCVIFKKKNELNFANCVLPEKMPIQWHNLQFFNFIFFHGDITLLLSVKLQCFIIVFLFIHYDLGLSPGRPHTTNRIIFYSKKFLLYKVYREILKLLARLHYKWLIVCLFTVLYVHLFSPMCEHWNKSTWCRQL